MSSLYTHLSSKHPMPSFDDHVMFYDYTIIDKMSLRVARGMPIDHGTGVLDLETYPAFTLPWWASLVNHKYFVDGIAIHGSVTGMKYFESFDSEAQSTRIACGDRIFTDSKYKYADFGRDALEANWDQLREASSQKHLLYENVERHYDEARVRSNQSNPRHSAFRTIHDPFAKLAIQESWILNRDKAGAAGTAMHNTKQYYYETPGCDLSQSRFDTVEFRQFRRFHDQWVLKLGLVPFRTELSMCDRNPKGRLPTFICGTIDILWKYAKDPPDKRPRRVVSGDWKRTVDVSTTSYDGKTFGKYPFEDWHACKTSERWLQLMVYNKIAVDNSYDDEELEVVSSHIIRFHEDMGEDCEIDQFIQTVPIKDVSVPGRMKCVFDEQREARCAALIEERWRIVDDLALQVRVPGGEAKEPFDNTNTHERRVFMSRTIRLIDIDKMLMAMGKIMIAKPEVEGEPGAKRTKK
jgi:hypothetical protein